MSRWSSACWSAVRTIRARCSVGPAGSTRCQALLRRSGIPVLDLVDYDEHPPTPCKVGTVKRAKGLEFGQVFLPRVESYLISDGAAEPERVQRERRELFVAMTRARDELWMGRLQAGRPKVY